MCRTGQNEHDSQTPAAYCSGFHWWKAISLRRIAFLESPPDLLLALCRFLLFNQSVHETLCPSQRHPCRFNNLKHVKNIDVSTSRSISYISILDKIAVKSIRSPQSYRPSHQSPPSSPQLNKTIPCRPHQRDRHPEAIAPPDLHAKDHNPQQHGQALLHVPAHRHGERAGSLVGLERGDVQNKGQEAVAEEGEDEVGGGERAEVGEEGVEGGDGERRGCGEGE